jgi:hypothetical protein
MCAKVDASFALQATIEVVVVETQALRWVKEVEWAQVCDYHSVCSKAMDELGTHISMKDTFRFF